MKKIVGIIAAASVAACAFAVDFNARVYMTGNIADGTIDITDDSTKSGAVNFWQLNKQDQKDADALVMSVNGDKSGANFQFWYNYDASGSANLVVRSTNLWFKPIDMLKVTVGDVSVSTYKESIDWWKVAVGNSASEHNSWSNGSRWSSYATVEGPGISVEATPIDGLWLSAGVTADTGSKFASLSFNDTDDETYAQWGAVAKYDFTNLLSIPLNAAISWRDNGKDSYKIAAIGAEYGNRFAAGVYGFLNVRLFFDKWSYSYFDNIPVGSYLGTTYDWNKDLTLRGIALDNMIRYQIGGFEIMGRFPVTIRGLVKDSTGNGKKASDYGYDVKTDPSYMSYEVKAVYALDSFNVYLDIENDNACTFDSNAKETFLNMTVQPGISLNVGSCAIDVGVNVAIPNNDSTNLAWSIPFTASVAF